MPKRVYKKKTTVKLPASTRFDKLPAKKVVEAETAKMTNAQLVGLLKRGASLASKRINLIEKRGYYSPAYEKYLGEENPKEWSVSVGTKRGVLLHKVAQLQLFLGAKTSTYQGIENVTAERASRILGKEASKQEVSEFSESEAQRRFWAAYEAFNQSYTQFYAESDRVQRVLGKMTFWRKRGFTAEDLASLNEMMSKDSQTVESAYRGGNYANVQAGRDWNAPNK